MADGHRSCAARLPSWLIPTLARRSASTPTTIRRSKSSCCWWRFTLRHGLLGYLLTRSLAHQASHELKPAHTQGAARRKVARPRRSKRPRATAASGATYPACCGPRHSLPPDRRACSARPAILTCYQSHLLRDVRRSTRGAGDSQICPGQLQAARHDLPALRQDFSCKNAGSTQRSAGPFSRIEQCTRRRGLRKSQSSTEAAQCDLGEAERFLAAVEAVPEESQSMTRERLYLFDTTLRDGAQTTGVDFSLEDKRLITGTARRPRHRLHRGRLSRRQRHRHRFFVASRRWSNAHASPPSA